jgi:hypothetical protein
VTLLVQVRGAHAAAATILLLLFVSVALFMLQQRNEPEN